MVLPTAQHQKRLSWQNWQVDKLQASVLVLQELQAPVERTPAEILQMVFASGLITFGPELGTESPWLVHEENQSPGHIVLDKGDKCPMTFKGLPASTGNRGNSRASKFVLIQGCHRS